SSEARAPSTKPTLRLAAFRRNRCPSGLRECAPHHPIALGRAGADRNSRTFLLSRADGHPGGQFARGIENFCAWSGFGDYVLRGWYADPRDLGQPFDRILMWGQSLGQRLIELGHLPLDIVNLLQEELE